MAVELLEDKKRWDQFVETSPQGLLFHKWDFLKTVERHSKYHFLPYAVYSGDELICIFPFFARRVFRLAVLNSPPPLTQIPYLGPAFDPGVQALKTSTKEKILGQVTNEVCREIDKIGPNYVSITTVPNFIDVRSFIWQKYREHLRFTYSVDLERSLDEIWASFTKNCRQKIKRVSAHSLEIQQTEDVNQMLDIWRQKFFERGIRVPLLSDNYLKELMSMFHQEMIVYNLFVDGKLATAEVCCAFQKNRYAIWIGGTSARTELGVTEYLDWEVVQRAKSEGFATLDLGVWDVGFSSYKAKFGPMLEPFFTLKKTDAFYKFYYGLKKVLGLTSKTLTRTRQ